MITGHQLHLIAPTCKKPEDTANQLNTALEHFKITSWLETVHFIAQACVESREFNVAGENLFYTHEDRLVQTFRSHFKTEEEAQPYVKNPKKLANYVYANINGNGDVDSGDGWNFRGGGWFQLTGRRNYAAASQAIYGDDRLVKNPDLLHDGTGLEEALCAMYYWVSNGCGPKAQADDLYGVTHIINHANMDQKRRGEYLEACKREIPNWDSNSV